MDTSFTNSLKYFILTLLLITVGCNKDEEAIDSNDCKALAPEVDYSRPSYFNSSRLFHYGYPLDQPWGWPMDIAIIDYNRDGLLDAITSNSDYTASFNNPEQNRREILFYKSDCDGYLTLDTSMNSEGWLGLVHARKSLVADFNNDSFPDVAFIGHGTDNDFAQINGEYPILLMSNPSGYDYVTYPDIVGGWHGGTAGDLDNDGDLDIYLPPSTLMVNNNGQFSKANLPFTVEDQSGASEILDIDGDGTLEIVYGSSDFSSWNDSWIGNMNGKIATFPVPDNYGIVVDLDFIDLDNDGVKEIVVNRVGDPAGTVGNYTGWFIQILKFVNSELIDITDTSIEQNSSAFNEWIEWFNVSDLDNNGTLDLYSNTDYIDVRWELIDGFLYRTK